jgi:NACalpha-BTF3-like transcription factor
MANVTLFVPDDLKKRMSHHKDVRWSSAIRTLIEDRLDMLEKSEELAQGSRLTDKDVAMLTQKVDADTRKHVKALMNANRN